MKIYTRTGDDGTTGLLGGGRVAKSEQRLAAFGTIDEFNAVLGVARAADLLPRCGEILLRLQGELFHLGAELATPPDARSTAEGLQDEDVAALEAEIDALEKDLPPLKAFILPSGSPAAAALHLARCVCRRAERELVTLAEQEPVRPLVLQYVNRLSDLLFVMARTANSEAHVEDVEWKPGS
jgi:cob(I)alamin adenosyltransferase